MLETSAGNRTASFSFGPWTVVEPCGEIDLVSISGFEHALDTAVLAGARLVVSFSRVTYLDGYAINALLGAAHEIGRRGGTFAIVVPAEHYVRRVFHIVALDHIVPIYESLAEAMGLLAPQERSQGFCSPAPEGRSCDRPSISNALHESLRAFCGQY